MNAIVVTTNDDFGAALKSSIINKTVISGVDVYNIREKDTYKDVILKSDYIVAYIGNGDELYILLPFLELLADSKELPPLAIICTQGYETLKGSNEHQNQMSFFLSYNDWPIFCPVTDFDSIISFLNSHKAKAQIANPCGNLLRIHNLLKQYRFNSDYSMEHGVGKDLSMFLKKLYVYSRISMMPGYNPQKTHHDFKGEDQRITHSFYSFAKKSAELLKNGSQETIHALWIENDPEGKIDVGNNASIGLDIFFGLILHCFPNFQLSLLNTDFRGAITVI